MILFCSSARAETKTVEKANHQLACWQRNGNIRIIKEIARIRRDLCLWKKVAEQEFWIEKVFESMRDKNKSRDVLFRWGPKSDPIFNVLGGGEWFGVFILQNVAIPGLGHSQSSIHVTWRATCREMAINIVSNDKIDAYTRCKIKTISLVDCEKWYGPEWIETCIVLILNHQFEVCSKIFLECSQIIYHDH